MKHNFLNFLHCPDCRNSLELSIFREEDFLCKEIIEGILRCQNCKKSFPIIEGIPRFVPNASSIFPEFFKKYPQLLKEIGEEKDFEKVHGETQRKFGMEWLKYPGSLPEDQKIFLEETQISEDEWKGKWVLDAGCGMGRYTRVAHHLGAEVVALDLGPALIRLWDLAVKSKRLHLVQGNLLSIPLKPKKFDIVYSLGVVHHTPSAEQSVKNLSECVKPQGQMTIWVYGTNGTYKNFKTNPLRQDRQGLRKMIFLVWLIVSIREFISNSLRSFTIHIPQNLLYALCYPLALIGKIPLIQYLTFSVHPLWRVRLQENFDWLSPPYQSHHTKEELCQWFEKNGFKVLRILPHGFVPKPGVLGIKETHG
ncbi:MAG: methyltransferase domain-containing protein [Elusimicrobia bacterium]|nr:methyltransferase domain-containing protein [Elusimicrobiota bacterium]